VKVNDYMHLRWTEVVQDRRVSENRECFIHKHVREEVSPNQQQISHKS